MPVNVVVPTLGESVVEATIARWLHGEGESVRIGEVLAELETDKVNTELSADDTGVLTQILHPVGATVRPGDVIAVIDPTAKPTAAAAPPAPPAPMVAAETPAVAASPVPTPAPAPETPPASDVRASPLAQKVAGEHSVDLNQVPASGPGGKVVRDDVESFVAQPAPVPTASAPAAPIASTSGPAPAVQPGRRETRQRMTRRRLTIARRLVEAQQTAAMLTTFNEVDLTAIVEIRKRRRDSFKEKHGVGLGFMSFFTKAVIGALREFPQLNAEIQGEEIILKQYYDIGIAIGDKDGLVVPVLRNADTLSFAEIEQSIAVFAQKSRDKALTLEDLQGGTFTITNGGVFGSLLSTPILNPPQVAILGMHTIQERPVAIGGQIVIRPMMYLALTYDHRIVDGREAVQFLVKIRDLLQDPTLMLLEG